MVDINSQKQREIFETYVIRLLDELTFIDSCFELWFHISNKQVDRVKELNIAPAFFTVVKKSLLNSAIISLAKLYENYDGKKRSGRNLMKFLNYVEMNQDIFPKDKDTRRKNRCNYLINSDLVNKHRQLIKDSKSKIDNLFYWRDKYYAHFDKKYFEKPETLGKDAELTIGHIRDLIKLATEILNDYSVAYNGTFHSIRATNLYDVDNVLEILHDYNRRKKQGQLGQD